MAGRGYGAAVALTFALAAAAPAAAQSSLQNPAEKAPIIATIDNFMKALTIPDAAAMSALLAPQSVFSGERKGPDGAMTVSRTPGDVWVGRMKAGGLVEKIYNPIVLQRGTIAQVWAPFDAVHDGKMSHCGIDAFDMVKIDGSWKIASVMWTTEPTGCKELKVPGY